MDNPTAPTLGFAALTPTYQTASGPTDDQIDRIQPSSAPLRLRGEMSYQPNAPHHILAGMNPDNNADKITDVAAGVIEHPDGRVLLAERPAGKPWSGYCEVP